MEKVNAAFNIAEQFADLMVKYHRDDLARMQPQELSDLLKLRAVPFITMALVEGANENMKDILAARARE